MTILELTNKIFEAFERNNITIGVFTDLKKMPMTDVCLFPESIKVSHEKYVLLFQSSVIWSTQRWCYCTLLHFL